MSKPSSGSLTFSRAFFTASSVTAAMAHPSPTLRLTLVYLSLLPLARPEGFPPRVSARRPVPLPGGGRGGRVFRSGGFRSRLLPGRGRRIGRGRVGACHHDVVARVGRLDAQFH